MKQRQGSHTVFLLQVHVVFCTKYRYRVLRGEVQVRCRDLIRQVCDALDVRIIKGVVSADHVHLHLSYPAKHSVSELVRRIKGRSARRLLAEYPSLRKRYWGGHFWGIGYFPSAYVFSDFLAQNRRFCAFCLPFLVTRVACEASNLRFWPI